MAFPILMGFDISILLPKVNYILIGLKEVTPTWKFFSYQLQILLKMQMSRVIQPYCSHSIS